jgi:glycerate kinase
VKLIVAGAPLPTLRATEVTDTVFTAWRRVRPNDEITVIPTSDGVAESYVGSGLDDALMPLARQCRLGGPGESRFAHCDAGEILLDYTDVLDGIPGPHSLTSRMVGSDLAWAVGRAGVSRIYVALPATGCVSDGGLALAEALAYPGATESVYGVRGEPRRPVAQREVSDWFARAASRVRNVDITVLAPEEQRLAGLAGIAHTWMMSGMPPDVAQQHGNELGAIAEMIERTPGAARAITFIGARPSSHDAFSGVGGMGLALTALGGHVYLAGEVALRSRLAPLVDTADLIVYVCGAIGENLPSGLAVAAEEAARAGAAVVVIYETGALRKGELPRLGIHGAYELFPGFDSADTPNVQALLSDVAGRVATTWGWD